MSDKKKLYSVDEYRQIMNQRAAGNYGNYPGNSAGNQSSGGNKSVYSVDEYRQIMNQRASGNYSYNPKAYSTPFKKKKKKTNQPQQQNTVTEHPAIYRHTQDNDYGMGSWNGGNRSAGGGGGAPTPFLNREDEERQDYDWTHGRGAYDAMKAAQQQNATPWDMLRSNVIREKGVYPKNLLERPEDYNDRSEEYDRDLYDFYYGKGMHDRIMQTGTRENKYRMFDQLKELWHDVDSGALANVDSYVRGKNAAAEAQQQPQQNWDTTGQWEKGNIDLNKRQPVWNDDGSISTEKSFSVNIDGKEVLLPTVINGKIVSEEEAIDHYKKTGKNLGIFDTVEDANAYAQQLHERQEKKYGAFKTPWDMLRSNVIRQTGTYPMTERPEDYNDHPDDYDRQLYDFYYGKGMHDRIMANGSYEVKQNMMAILRDLWHDIDSGALETVDRYVREKEKAQKPGTEAAEEPEPELKDYVGSSQGDKNIHDKNGDIVLGGDPRKMTQYEEYESTDAKQRGAKAAEILNAENYAKYVQENAYSYWQEIEANEAKINAIRNDAQANIDRLDPIGKEMLDRYEYRPDLASYEGLIGDEYYQHLITKPADYEKNKEKYDREIIEFFTGDFNLYDTMGEIEREEMLKELWAPIESGEVAQMAYEVTGARQWESDYEANAAAIRFADHQSAVLEQAKEERENYNKLLNQYGDVIPERADFNPEYDRGGGGYSNDSAGGTSSIHRIYSLLGGGKEKAYWLQRMGDNPQITNEYRCAMLMLDGSNGHYDEIGKFMELYNTAIAEHREPTEAKAFLEGLEPALLNRYRDAEKIGFAEAARKYPILSSGASVGLSLVDPVTDVIRHVLDWTGSDAVRDPDSWLYFLDRYKDTVESTIAGDIGGIGGKIYSNFMNSASNFVRALTTPNASKLMTTIVSLGQFFLQVDQESTYRHMVDGYGYDTAKTMGAVDGMFEVLEELLPFETMLGSEGRGLWKSLAMQAASEFGQEFTGASLFEKINGFLFGEDPEQVIADDIFMRRGYTNDKGDWVDLSKADNETLMNAANLRAAKQFWQQAMEQGIGGAVGGFLGGSYGSIINTVNTANTGKIIRSEENTVDGKSGIDRLIETGTKMEGTESEKQAKKLAEKKEKGKKLTNYEIGRLANTMAEEAGEGFKGAVSDTLVNRIRNQLHDMGIIGNPARKISEAIAKGLTGEKMTKEDRQAIAERKETIELWRSYNSISENALEARKEIAAATEGTRSVANLLGDLTGKTAQATGVAANEIDRSNKEADTIEGAIDNFANRRGDLMSEAYAETAKGLAKGAKNSKTFLADAMAIRMAAYAYNTAMPKTNMSEAAAERLWKAATEERDKLDAERIRNHKILQPGKGVVTYEGESTETDAWLKATKKLGDEAQQQMKTIAYIAKALGHRVNFFYDATVERDKSGKVTYDHRYVHGWEDSATGTIEINVAGMLRSGARKNMMVTIAHEMTHYLEQNSKEGYAQLRQFILDNLKTGGMNVEQRLVDLIDNQNSVVGKNTGDSMDLTRAMFEVVAQGCEELLTSQELIDKMAEENPSLLKQIRGFIQNIINRLTAGMDDSLSEEARILHNVREDIAKMWFAARAEALGRQAEGKAEKGTAEGKSYSLAAVKPVKTSDRSVWQPGHSEAWFRENGFPIYMDVPLEQQEINRDTRKKGHGTQIPSTVSTYRKIYDRLKKLYPDTWQDMRILDASSGLGLGTQAGREMGFNVTDIEPFPNDTYHPDYTDYTELQRQVESGETEAFDFIISNAVLNVIPQDTRDNLVDAMGSLLKPGGSIFVNVISKDYEGAINSNPNIQESIKNRRGSARTMEGDYSKSGNAAGRGHETFVWGSNSVQKVFSTPELIGYLKDALGPGYTVKRDSIGMTGVLVTKDERAAGKRYSTAQMDKNYLAAVKAGDMETAQRLVDEAAKRAGYTIRGYHGTNAKFTVFDPEKLGSKNFMAGSAHMGFFISKSRETAESYTGLNSMDVMSMALSEESSAQMEKIKKKHHFDEAAKKNEKERKAFEKKYKEEHGYEKEVEEPYNSLIQTGLFKNASEDQLNALRMQWEYDWNVKNLNNMNSAWRETKEAKQHEELSEKIYKEWEAYEIKRKGYIPTVMNLYVKMEKPFVHDFKGEGRDTESFAARMAKAKEQGCDGCIFKNVADGADIDDIYTVFSNTQIKSADPVTYDDDGNVIPLSKRFNTKEADIRYSTAQMDTEELDKEYLASVNLGYFGSAEKMVDEAAKRAGYTIKAYHGTPNGKFNVFDKSKVGTSTDFGKLGRGFYFSTKKQVADYYAGYLNSSTVMPVYLKLDNPFVLDHNYDNMTVRELYDSILGKGGMVDEKRSEELTKWLVDNGYDGIEADGEYMVLDPKNIKSAETITYDKYGDIIPLSERFRTDHDENWKNSDIRYSTAQIDKNYEAAVNANDMEKAQRIIDSAAKKKGFTAKVYHGTPTGGFTVFKDWSYFTKNKAYADRYRHTSASSIRSYAVNETQPQTYELYMNPGKVFDTRDPEAARIYNEMRMEYGLGELSNTSSGLPDWTDGRDIIEFIEENGLNYDTILLDEGGDPGENGPVSRGISYVTRNNRIKSAEAVTYDKEGKVIPPSKRFSIKENDIRFSMASPVEVNRDGLIAVHNLGEDQLIKTLQLGGFPMPSIAIIKNDYAHNRYGDISVVFYPSTIDPRASRDNKVYGGDAWTPTYPSIEYKINSKELSRVTKRLQKLVPESVWNSNGNYVHLYEENLENSLNRSRGDVVSALSNVDVLKIAYMEDTGKKIEYPTRETDLDGFHRFKNDQVLRVLDVLGEDTVREAYEGGWDYYNEHPEVIEKIRQTLNEMFREKHKNVGLKIAQMDLYSADKFGPNYAQMIVDAANRYLNEGIQTETDSAKMWEQLKDLNEDEDYQAWVRNQFGNIIEKKGIRNSKDVFTNNGNRRSWDALHDEETLENVVRMMKAQADKGSNSFFSQSEMLALGTRDLKSLEDIRKHSGQLKHISDEEMSAAKTEIVNGFGELMEELRNKKESNQFIARDRALEAMVEAVRKTRTPEGIMRELKRYGDLDVPADAGVRIANLMQQIADLPTEYFEAKPQRAVGLNEIAKVIVPETVGQELLNELDKRNIPYEMYDGTDEERLRIMNEQKDARFSVALPDLEVKQFMLGLNEASLTTVQEKTMLRQFKELNAAREVAYMALTKRQQELAKLEAKTNPSAYDKEEMQKLRIRIESSERKLEKAERDLAKATGEKGFARMMREQGEIARKVASGRTAEEVRATIDALTKDVERITKEMDARQQQIDSMKDDLAFRKQASLVNQNRADKMATQLRKEYGSSIDRKELIRSMTEIRLKMMRGMDISDDVEALAWRIAAGTRGEGSVTLNLMRGRTIVLGKSQLAELKGQGSSLKEVRSALAGTGIKVKTGETGSLDADWSEWCDIVPSLHRDANPGDQLDEILKVVADAKRHLSGEEMFRDNIEDVIMDLKASIASIDVDAPTDPAAMKILNRMNSLVNEMAEGVTKSAEELKKARAALAKLVDGGKMAVNLTDRMQQDIDASIRYNNALAEQSEAALWKNEKFRLIEQLKSENTQNLIREQQKWRARMERDALARDQMQTNLQLRKEVNTNIQRMKKLLVNETDLKNIPEHMKSLARYVIGQIISNDLYGRKIAGMSEKDMIELRNVLRLMDNTDGIFTPEDLKAIGNEEKRDLVEDALADLTEGIRAYNQSTKGQPMLTTLGQLHDALEKISGAVADIKEVIDHERTIVIGDRRQLVSDAAAEVAYDMRRSKFKGETRGLGSKQMNMAKRAVFWGNMTPVYFFRFIKNRGMAAQWKEFEAQENRNGLELQKASEYIRQIAEEAGYKDWTGQTVKVKIGDRDMEVTVDQIMTLYAIWIREKVETPDTPDTSFHLPEGGVFFEQQDERNTGKLRHERTDMRPVKIDDATVERMYAMLTEKQKKYIDKMVHYLSTEMSELGNEASMKMYGIKKYKEKWYFPMNIWNGVRSARSDLGISGNSENRGAHKGWTKRRRNNASNALVIGNFTDVAVKHIVEMINYNTVVPAIENLNKVLNYQEEVVANKENAEDGTVKRNIRIRFEEAYGKDALNYLETFLKDLNGGTVQDQRKTLREAALSMFKKNAVAGSLSVAAQQPLSYIRAAMLINPKYLARAINPQYYKGSYAEMMKYSGVAVIKDMGRFDMGFGQSAKDFVSPDQKQNLYEKVSDKLTIAPEMMDRMTWTRMWTAVKLETAAKNPGMSTSSEEFLKKCGERFNEIMRRTQVYDSVLVKSSNMRSQNYTMKVITSFMAEPTLSLNVLADAVRNFKEEGGKALAGKAAATFIMSAVMQSLVKGLIGSGRTPDDKKTWLENFLYKWFSAFLSEANPASLIPGYSDIVEVIKNGELSDDAMGAIGKIFATIDTAGKAIQGKGKGWYRDLEDTIGQLTQLFTNIPAKNLMRDGRAMWNWFIDQPYADRPDSGAVIRGQTKEAIAKADTLLGAINAKLGDAGYKTDNNSYYQRIYNAKKAGNEAGAQDMIEYLLTGKGVKKDSITNGLTNIAKADTSLTVDQKAKLLTEKGGDINATWWKLDRDAFKKETGKEENVSGNYYRLTDAINKNNATEIQRAIKDLLAHGVTKDKIKGKLSDWKSEYLEATSDGKRKIRDALQKAFRAIGMTAADADALIESWTKTTKKKKKN